MFFPRQVPIVFLGDFFGFPPSHSITTPSLALSRCHSRKVWRRVRAPLPSARAKARERRLLGLWAVQVRNEAARGDGAAAREQNKTGAHASVQGGIRAAPGRPLKTTSSDNLFRLTPPPSKPYPRTHTHTTFVVPISSYISRTPSRSPDIPMHPTPDLPALPLHPIVRLVPPPSIHPPCTRPLNPLLPPHTLPRPRPPPGLDPPPPLTGGAEDCRS